MLDNAGPRDPDDRAYLHDSCRVARYASDRLPSPKTFALVRESHLGSSRGLESL